MIDLQLQQNSDGAYDLALFDDDLAHADDLQSAVLISLLSDARAAEDDLLPDSGNDHRGWWADAINTVASGSKLWLEQRAKHTTETVRNLEQYARDALQWLIDAGHVQELDVQVVAKDHAYAIQITLDQRQVMLDPV